MTEPHELPDLFVHNSQFLGEFDGVDRSDGESTARAGFDIAFFKRTDLPVTSAVSNGLRFQTIRALIPEELICTLRSDQIGFSRHLVRVTAHQIMQRRQGLEYDSIIAHTDPIITDTQICGVLGYPSPFFGNEFDLVRSPDGQPKIQMITLLPVTPAEVEYVRDNSADELWEHWRSNRVDILDIGRQSSI